MLPISELDKRISEAYQCMENEDVSGFQKLDAEINALVPNYVQQIGYASSSVSNLNKLQWTNKFTQFGKILGAMIVTGFSVAALRFADIAYLSQGSSFVIVGMFLLYLWKKIPQIRMLRNDIQVFNEQALLLTNTISQSILAVNKIKGFQQSTFHKLEEWEKRGLLDPEEAEKEQNDQFANSLKKMTDDEDGSGSGH